MIVPIVSYFDRLSRPLLNVLGFGGVCLVGLVDYVTGSQLSFAIFYLVPISIIAWFAGRPSTYPAALLSAGLWFNADIGSSVYSNAAYPFWNASVRLVIFLLVGYLVSEIRKLNTGLEEKVLQRTSELNAELTRRTETEQQLKEAERRYHSLYASMSEGVALHELVLNEAQVPIDYRILDVNPAYESITTINREELVGRLASEVHEKGLPHYLDICSNVALSGEPASFRTRFELMGKSFKVSAFSPAKNQFATVLEDVTEVQKLQDQLLQSQKLEGIGRLAGGVAHDFNNLLTAIIGYTDLLIGQTPKLDPRYQDLQEIKRSSDRAADLTKQLLAFSRKQILQPVVADLNAIVEGMNRMLKRLLGEDIELVTRLGTELEPVKVDPGQIEQVILNLALNARDAMPHGGKLTIETSTIELDDSYARVHVSVRAGVYVMIAVSDTGTGMDAETVSQVFEPFFTTKETGKGTGLGLSTAYGIVKQSGGNIWVYSEPGKGSTFKVYLPRVEGAAEILSTDKEDFSAVANGTETILVVEDEVSLRNLIQKTLERSGYKVLLAATGDEALRLASINPEPIHLILTDVVMPGISGRQMVQQLHPFLPKAAVLFMSGYTDNAIVHHGVLDQGVHFLQKPFTPAGLCKKLRAVLDEKKI